MVQKDLSLFDILLAQCSVQSLQCQPSQQVRDNQAKRFEVPHTDHLASLHSPARDTDDQFTTNCGEIARFEWLKFELKLS